MAQNGGHFIPFYVSLSPFLAEVILEAKASPNIVNSIGETPLMLAVNAGFATRDAGLAQSFLLSMVNNGKHIT